jgi:membrane protein YqaA with SNARE-associated domain
LLELLEDLLGDYPYLLVFVIILGVSAAPILTPPTWMIVTSAYVLSDNSLNPLLLAMLAATAATAGRVIILKYSSLGRNKLSERRKASLKRLECFLQNKRYGYFLGTLIFAVTPLPSNMLFISYGLMNVKSIGIVAGFWIGRVAVYLLMMFISGFIFTPLASIAQDNFIGVLITDIAGILMTIFALVIDWEKAIYERRLAIIKPRLR